MGVTKSKEVICPNALVKTTLTMRYIKTESVNGDTVYIKDRCMCELMRAGFQCDGCELSKSFPQEIIL